MKILCYTDGSANNTTNLGGWGYVIVADGALAHYDYSPVTLEKVTSNQMEMMAATRCLHALSSIMSEVVAEAESVTIHCDSQYTINGITKWVAGWQRRGWVTADYDPVKNRIEWKRMITALAAVEESGHTIHWKWVRGHAGNFWNEVVDRLAAYKGSADRKSTIVGRIQSGSLQTYEQLTKLDVSA